MENRWFRHAAVGLLSIGTLAAVACDGRSPTDPDPERDVADNLVASQQFPTIFLPQGFRIEKVIEGLTYPTAMTFDDQGRMYVAEAGGAFLDLPPAARILRIENGRATEVVNLESRGIQASVVGLVWHNGALFVSHRDADRTGAVSRVTLNGSVTRILTGIEDSQSEHQVNDIKVGPDGRMYLASGPAGNAAVVGLDLAPFVMLSPNVRHRPCQDIVLTGVNFRTPDFRTDDPSDLAETGAFVPFGTTTTPGQRIAGVRKCGGAILTFDPNNAEATVQPFAHGLRNVIGLAFRQNGEMLAAVNGYDVRGSRPFNDRFDATYRIRQGTWYGYPDFSLGTFELISDPKFEVPNSLKAPQFVSGQAVGKSPQRPVIDHAASRLTPPDRSVVAGLHPVNSSPSGIDVAPGSFGSFGDQAFVAEWGDLAPPTTPLRDLPVGSRIVRLNPNSNRVEPFVRNAQRGPASEQGAMGMGLERPYYVKFGPDGAMYIVDYGIARINPPSMGTPYEFPPNTGIIWKVTRTN